MMKRRRRRRARDTIYLSSARTWRYGPRLVWQSSGDSATIDVRRRSRRRFVTTTFV